MSTTTSIDINSDDNIRLPKGWTKATRVGVLQVLSLAKFVMAHTRSFAANSPIERLRLKGENEQLTQGKGREGEGKGHALRTWADIRDQLDLRGGQSTNRRLRQKEGDLIDFHPK